LKIRLFGEFVLPIGEAYGVADLGLCGLRVAEYDGVEDILVLGCICDRCAQDDAYIWNMVAYI
jgi:hypothetical protein